MRLSPQVSIHYHLAQPNSGTGRRPGSNQKAPKKRPAVHPRRMMRASPRSSPEAKFSKSDCRVLPRPAGETSRSATTGADEGVAHRASSTDLSGERAFSSIFLMGGGAGGPLHPRKAPCRALKVSAPRSACKGLLGALRPQEKAVHRDVVLEGFGGSKSPSRYLYGLLRGFPLKWPFDG